MLSFGICLPKVVQDRLALLCVDLPHVQWLPAHDLYLTFLFIGRVEEGVQLDIQEKVEEIRFAPFSLSLKGVECFSSRKDQGSIEVRTVPSEPLQKLKQEISSMLRRELQLVVPSEKRHAHPHVTLGHFDKIDAKKFSLFMASCHDFESPPFLVDSYALIHTQKTQRQQLINVELARYTFD